MSRFGFLAMMIAGAVGMLMLAACGPVRADSAAAGGSEHAAPSGSPMEQPAPSASPNIVALQDAGAGRLQRPAFVEFYSDDCDICRRIQGPMRTLDLQYDGKIKFIYIDIDLSESQPFVRRFDVRGIPMFVLLGRRGDTVRMLPGWPGQDAVAASLDQLLGQQ